MLVLIYVDDILIMCSNHAAIRDLLTALHCEFAVKELGAQSRHFNKLFQFIHKPTELYWQSDKSPLRYIKHTMQFRLRFQKSSVNHVHALLRC